MKKKLLAALGFLAVVIAMAIGGQFGREAGKVAFSPSKPSTKEIEAKLIEGFTSAANEINQKCPMMIDEETRLDRASVGPGPRAVYHLTLPNYKSNDIDPSLIRTKVRPEVVEKVCNSEKMKKSLQLGGIYVYSYHGNDAVKIASFEVDRSDCGFAEITP